MKPQPPTDAADRADAAAEGLATLLDGDGGTGTTFWQSFLPLVADWTNAREAAVLRPPAPSAPTPLPPPSDDDSTDHPTSDDRAPSDPAAAPWTVFAHHRAAAAPPPPVLRAAAATLGASGDTATGWRTATTAADGTPILLVGLPLHGTGESPPSMLAIAVPRDPSDETASHTLARLRLAAAIPAAAVTRHALARARADTERMARVVDVVARANTGDRFIATAISFCNALAAAAGCDRVSLGWRHGGFIRLAAISRVEKFDRRMEAARFLETAMDEARDQDEEILWPPPDPAPWISRDHERLARHQESGHLCSLPLRVESETKDSHTEIEGVVTCERADKPFSPEDVQFLRLACDLVTGRLHTLRRSDRWFGARWAARTRALAAKAVGPRHTWVKVLVVFLSALLAFLAFARVEHRPRADFILRSDEMTHLTAPFDGYLAEVLVRPGDPVTAGQPLARLDTNDLELELTAATAEAGGYRRTLEKARAERALADMRVAEARLAQTEARLEWLRHRLDQSEVRAPRDGVLVEGDWTDRIGAALKLGDPMFQVARIDRLFVEARLDERDLDHVRDAGHGEISFVARPREAFPVAIELIHPGATEGATGPVFLVRCALPETPEPWWRPGMSGVCKFDCGQRPLLWILSHRTLDFLRLRLWW